MGLLKTVLCLALLVLVLAITEHPPGYFSNADATEKSLARECISVSRMTVKPRPAMPAGLARPVYSEQYVLDDGRVIVVPVPIPPNKLQIINGELVYCFGPSK